MVGLQELLKNLIQFESITPADAGCQDYMLNFFEQTGFVCQKMDNAPVSNFFARFGSKSPLLVFAGHTDVVCPGDLNRWHASPFELHENGKQLIGRGVADMKGALAAMMHMAARYVQAHPDFEGSLGFLITSGEEGEEYDKGTPYMMQVLKDQGISIDYCVVGEPSSAVTVGDTLKIGRRGSLTGYLSLKGKQGHVAYPHLALNPIHAISPVIAELSQRVWDEGNAYFPPTSFQISHISAGTDATNVIPGEIILHFNFRYSTEQTVDQLKTSVMASFKAAGLTPDLVWRHSGEPFLTSSGVLLTKTMESIEALTDKKPALSTSGGTSDGRFIAPFGVEVLELGLINASIHQINEWTRLEDLELLEKIYFNLCENIFL